MKDKIIIVGSSPISAQISQSLKDHSVEVWSPEQAKERGVRFNEPEPIQYIAPKIFDFPNHLTNPLTRKERRKQERDKRKNSKP